MYTGARNVIHPFQAQKMLELIESERVTISNWVPTMASFALSLPEVDARDLSSLRALVFAAAPLAPSLLEEVKRRICPNIYEYYGLQETGILTQLGPEEKEKKPDSVGKVIFSAEVRNGRLFSERGKDPGGLPGRVGPHGGPGEIR
jgi:acyl-CoA synthetase (AMP-forming)/AMP-acid ligase II